MKTICIIFVTGLALTLVVCLSNGIGVGIGVSLVYARGWQIDGIRRLATW